MDPTMLGSVCLMRKMVMVGSRGVAPRVVAVVWLVTTLPMMVAMVFGMLLLAVVLPLRCFARRVGVFLARPQTRGKVFVCRRRCTATATVPTSDALSFELVESVRDEAKLPVNFAHQIRKRLRRRGIARRNNAEGVTYHVRSAVPTVWSWRKRIVPVDDTPAQMWCPGDRYRGRIRARAFRAQWAADNRCTCFLGTSYRIA